MNSTDECIEVKAGVRPVFNSQLEFLSCGECGSYLRSSPNWIPKFCSECGTKIDYSEVREDE